MNIVMTVMIGTILALVLFSIVLHLKANRARKAIRYAYGSTHGRKSKKRRNDHDAFWFGGGVSDAGSSDFGSDSSCSGGSDGGGGSSCGGGCGGGGD